MLTEHFIASIGAAAKAPLTNSQKDASIFIHEFQPLLQPRSIFKKSSTGPHSLAVSSTHIFAAQADKAVVHVYSREKGNQEATVPFPERITCLTLACDESVLVLGTAEGRILCWEVASGRQITTSQAHLQAVTVLAADRTSNFLLSASADSTVHAWSLPALLSFATVDVQAVSSLSAFTSHRAEVVALTLGHSSSFCNFVISASKDKTCLVWDYHTGTVMRTYLLPEMPTCLAIDAADRCVYVGYEDCSLQQLHLFDLRSESDLSAPLQPSLNSKWKAADDSMGAVLSIGISFDGYTILTGHEAGSICSWDGTGGRSTSTILQAPLPGPVTNLAFLPVTGFPDAQEEKVKIPAVIKPKFGAFDNANAEMPGNYSLSVAFPSDLPKRFPSTFEEALIAPSFPQHLLDAGLEELSTWGNRVQTRTDPEEAEDFMALDEESNTSRKLTLEEQNAGLKQELEALRRVQKASFERMEKMRLDNQALSKRQRKITAVNGARNGMNDTSDED